MNDNILKKIWQNEDAIKENLLPTKDVRDLYDSLISHLEATLIPGSLPSLRFRKIKVGKSLTWWSSLQGYPFSSQWDKFQQFIELLAQNEAEKTIKKRLEIEGLFVESRSRGEDQTLLVGKNDGTGDKAHITIDGKSGEIRVEDGRTEPTELLAKIETTLTLPSGKKIRTTREAVEEILFS